MKIDKENIIWNNVLNTWTASTEWPFEAKIVRIGWANRNNYTNYRVHVCNKKYKENFKSFEEAKEFCYKEIEKILNDSISSLHAKA